MNILRFSHIVYLCAIILMTTFSTSLHAEFPIGPFNWKTGDNLKELPTSANHVCVLTKVGGKFDAQDDVIRVWYINNEYYKNWYLGNNGKPYGPNEPTASAYCFLHSSFAGDGVDYWNSEPFTIEKSTQRPSCNAVGTETWWGDAGTYISGMGGNFNGGAEFVEVNQSSEGFKASSITASTCKNYLVGFAQAFFVGKAHAGHSGRFWGPNGAGAADFAGEYKSFSKEANKIQMAPVEETMCYFTKIRGKFQGAGEYAEIVPVVNNQNVRVWELRTASAGGQGVWANARCFRRDQRCGAAGCVNERVPSTPVIVDPGTPGGGTTTPGEPQKFTFCAVFRGSGSGQKEFEITANSYDEAYAILVQNNLGGDASSYQITPGKCSYPNSGRSDTGRDKNR